MQKEEIINFLTKFEIENKKLEKFFENKKIILKNKNIFLDSQKFLKNQVYCSNILYIFLQKQIPSKYFLSFIAKNSTKLELKNKKQALNFTYSKDIKINSLKLKNENELKDKKYYILEYNKQILGFVEYNKKNKILKNRFNIGEYLYENN